MALNSHEFCRKKSKKTSLKKPGYLTLQKIALRIRGTGRCTYMETIKIKYSMDLTQILHDTGGLEKAAPLKYG